MNVSEQQGACQWFLLFTCSADKRANSLRSLFPESHQKALEMERADHAKKERDSSLPNRSISNSKLSMAGRAVAREISEGEASAFELLRSDQTTRICSVVVAWYATKVNERRKRPRSCRRGRSVTNGTAEPRRRVERSRSEAVV